MGFFDFLSSPSQDVGSLQKEQAELRKRMAKAPSQEAAPLEEAKPFEPKEPLPEEPFQGRPAKDPALARRQYSDRESRLVKKEQQIVSQVKGILDTSFATYYNAPEIVKVKEALGKGSLSPYQLASDIDVILEKKGFNTGGNVIIDPGQLQKLSHLRNELSVVLDERGEFEAEPRPQSAAQSSPDELEANSIEASQKAAAIRREASSLGVLASAPKIREAQILESQASAMRQEAMRMKRDLEGQERKAQEIPQAPPPRSPEEIPLQGNIERNLAGSGKTKESFNLAVVGAWKEAEKSGLIDINGLEDQVPFGVAFRTLLPILDPTQKVTMDLVDLVNKQKQTQIPEPGGAPSPQGGQMPEGESPALMELRAKQKERRDLILSLGQSPSSQNWLSAIVTILLSAVIGSERALSVMGYASRHNLLKYQLDLLHQEINEDMAILKEESEAKREVRREAARRMTRQEDTADQRKWELSKLMLNHNLLIQRSEKRGDPETAVMKKLSAEFNRSLGIAAKYSKTKDDPFASEASKREAKMMFDKYVRKAMDLDATLQELSGTSEEEVPAGVDEE